MSKTIDQRVVEMRFDNRDFESNVKTSMGTLEKLKRSLNMKGASKSLESVNKAAKNVNLNPLGSAVETVQLKFSALQVAGITALTRITNAAINTGERMIKALTIDPVKTGFQEYETQMNSVQTILANTQSKGSTLDDVNTALDTLNKYADQTIYNFTEMTRNIGTFTAAGVDLQTSVDSIKGIANLAAVSGSSSQQASTAMYQLSQALAAGRVSLMDWNSVVNAGMGGELFQNALIRTSELLKTGAKDAINTYGSFRESLTQGEWLTTEVLTETLKQLSGAYTEAELIAQGFTEEQAKEITKLADTAVAAATEVKTFTQLWDVLKESAQSGWSQTWKLIVGDFEEAKALLSPLAEVLTGFIGKMSDARNTLIESALGKSVISTFDGINNVLNGAKKSVDGVLEPVKKVTGALEDLDAIADKVILGSFGNGDERFTKLTEAGYNYYRVQNKVNETLGVSYRHSEELIASQDKALGTQTKTTEKTTEQTDETVKLNDEQKKQLAILAKMTDEQLKANGYSEDQIATIRELRNQAEKLGMSTTEFIYKLDEINGRWLLIESFKNIGKGLINIFTTMGKAWKSIFDKTTEERANGIFNVLSSIHRMTSKFEDFLNPRTTAGKNNIDKLRRSFEGLFAAIDIVTTLVGGGFKIAFKFISQLLSYFNLDIFDVTASVGDVIVKFRDWIDNTLDFTKAIDKVAPYIEKAVTAIKEWFTSVKDSDIAQNIVDGLVNGIKDGIPAVGEAIVSLATSLVDKIKSFLGIHSPSTVFITIGAMIIAGLVLGLQNGDSSLWEAIKGIGTTLVEAFKNGFTNAKEGVTNFFDMLSDGVKNADVLDKVKGLFSGLFDFIKRIFVGIGSFLGNIDFGALLGTGLIVGILFTINKVASVAEKFANPLDKLGDMFEGIGDMFTGLGKSFQASAFLKKTQGIYNLAKAIALLALSFVLLASVSWPDIWKGVVVIGALGGVLAGLAFAVSKINPGDFNFKFGFESGGILALAASLLIVAIAVKKLADIDQTALTQGMVAVVILAGIMAFLVQATKYGGKDIDKIGSTLIKMSAAMLILVYVAKIIGEMKTENLVQGIIGIAAFGAIIAGMIWMTKLAGNAKRVDALGGTIVKIALAILLMVGIAKIIAKMPGEELVKGMIGIIAFGAIVTGLIAATRLAGGAVAEKLGRTILAVAGAIMLLAFTAKILASMSTEDLIKGVAATVALGAVITGLIAATRLAGGRDFTGLAGTILAVSAAIGILAAVAIILGLMSIEHLAKGIIAVGLLSTMMAGLIIATRGASECKGNLIVMAVAIGVMAAAVIALSLIDTKKLIAAAGSLSLVMGMFALMTKMSGTAKSSMGSLIVMTVAVGLMGGMLYLLAQLPVEDSIGSAVALGTLMLALSGTLFIMSKIKTSVLNALIGIGLLTLMAVPMLAFVGVLALMQNIQNATNNAILLTAMMTVMTVLLAALTVIGAFGVAAIAGVGCLLAMAVPMLAFVGVLALMQNIENANANAKLLMGMMTTMTNLLVKIALVAPLAVIGVGALTAMTGLMVGIGVLAVAVGALMEKFPALQQFLDTGIPILEKLAYTLGSLVANLINGFVNNLDLSGLVGIGYQLSMFMFAVQPFIAGAKMVDDTVLAGVGILTAAILALTAADVINGIMSFLPGAEGFAQLGTQLTQFMTNAWPFLVMATMIDPAAMEGVKALAETIMILTGAKLIEGLTSFIKGGMSLSDFGAQLGGLATGLNDFASNLGEFDESKVQTVTNAANAIKAIAEAAAALPNDGGWAGKIFGENSIATFGTKLPLLGYNLKTFAANLGTFDDAALSTVDCAAKAILKIAEAANEIPNEGGIWASIFGDNSLATFAQKLPLVGTYLSRFASNLGTFTDDQVSTIDCACKAIKAMAEAAQGIDGQAEWAKKLFGDNSLSTFGADMAAFGGQLKTFVTNLGTFGKEQVTTVNSAVKAINAFAKLADADLKSAKKNIEGFGETLPGFASDISDFVTNMPEGESISAAATGVSYLITLINNIASAKTADLSTFSDSLKSIGTEGIEAFVNAFSDGSAVSKVKKGASTMVQSLIDGAEAKLASVQKAFKTIAGSGANSIKEKYQSFYDAGSHLVSGFASGISANSYKAAAKAKAMAEAAEQAAKEALDINSPSKVFRAIGSGVPEGFAQGVGMLGTVVRGSAENMAKSAIGTVSKSIARISDIVNSDIDAQPTIRPVLDLSDIESGAGRINSLMNMGNSIGVSANVGAISSMMSSYGQNGNGDIVSAIDKLRSDISNMDRASYNINGITYDDGSNITNAVQTLVRAAKIERRV